MLQSLAVSQTHSSGDCHWLEQSCGIRDAQLVMLMGVDVEVSLRHCTPYAVGWSEKVTGVSHESGTEGSRILGPHASGLVE